MELHVWCAQVIKPIHEMMGWCRALKLEIAELGGVVDQSAAITAVQDAQVVYLTMQLLHRPKKQKCQNHSPTLDVQKISVDTVFVCFKLVNPA